VQIHSLLLIQRICYASIWRDIFGVFYVRVACWWRQSAVAGVVPSHYGTGIKHKLGIDATFPVFIGAGDIQLERDAVAIAITKTTEEDL
jgi:hypothetical protein